MQKMGIEALYRKPNTSRKHPENRWIQLVNATQNTG